MKGIEQAALNIRSGLTLSIAENLTQESILCLVLRAIRAETSRCYSSIADELGVEIVWGSGGGQTRRVAELEEKGIPYVRISESEYSFDSDKNALQGEILNKLTTLFTQ